ncbi:hypothetical protein AYO21_08629 [Fonsecaea monophora]|uniref:Xylanolytic transcriptional activator regulatory domain-containing protein n=1 Tax=Fonsecaea monophora TaxID=254056 RepID=A0A177F0T0_9EURO|nr:hypothetical protein AYO21_08629 [Fonsecaea monophora]OAG37211.1 hypothetical protein AYO21_08629 [Fonsecaea monophora]
MLALLVEWFVVQLSSLFSSWSEAGNKPDTVEKLLSRINHSSVRDQVINALLASTSARDSPSQADDVSIPSNAPFAYTTDSNGDPRQSLEPGDGQTNSAADGPENQQALEAPFRNWGAKVNNLGSTTSRQNSDRLHLPVAFRLPYGKDAMDSVAKRLTNYFSPRKTLQKDWHYLAAQSVNSTFRLEKGVCDPITARLIDEDDVSLYFKLFLELRNPFVGLLDPLLHTPDYVYSMSFTLFSVVCALGCAVSTLPRDRVVYPALFTLAEGCLKWSIASSVKSIETIQAIIIMQYWAPVHQKQSDDPYWLQVNHAVRLAREIGVDKATVVTEHLSALPPSTGTDTKERIFRNFERTWLYTFIADKSFGIINGRRPLNVSRHELPVSATTWWQHPMATPHDRMISGIIEIRVLLMHALEDRQRSKNDVTSISNWHLQALQTLEQARDSRCSHDGDPSSKYLPILAFYMDHSILILNAQAAAALRGLDGGTASPELRSVLQTSVTVASHLMDIVLSEQIMFDLKLGSHNNLFIIICHAATEIIFAIKCDGIASTSVAELAVKMNAVLEQLGSVAGGLPASSAAHLYLDFFWFLMSRFDDAVSNDNHQNPRSEAGDDTLFPDWYRVFDESSMDLTGFLDNDVLGWDQPLFSHCDFANETC